MSDFIQELSNMVQYLGLLLILWVIIVFMFIFFNSLFRFVRGKSFILLASFASGVLVGFIVLVQAIWEKVDVKYIVEHANQLSIILLIVTYLFLLLLYALQEQRMEPSGLLTRLLIGAFSASTIPTGIILIICAFANIKLIGEMQGVGIYVAVAGISLISIAVLAVVEEAQRIKNSRKIRTTQKQ